MTGSLFKKKSNIPPIAFKRLQTLITFRIYLVFQLLFTFTIHTVKLKKSVSMYVHVGKYLVEARHWPLVHRR